uniref:GRIP domain-containing protein n=1 Tax=Arcella intermedia TaxID=1963864 RepID=A0A6B2L200_9EUKA
MKRQYLTLLQSKEEEIQILKVQLDLESRRVEELRKRKNMEDSGSLKAKKENEVLKEKYSALMRQRVGDAEKMQEIQLESEQDKAICSSLRTELQALKKQLEEKESEILKCNGELGSASEVMKVNSELILKQEQLEKDLQEAKSLSDTQTALLHTTQQELTSTKSHNDHLQSSLSSLQQQYDLLLTSSSSQSQQIAHLTEKHHTAQEDLQRLKSHLITSEKDNEEYLSELKNKLEEYQKLEKIWAFEKWGRKALPPGSNEAPIYESHKKELIDLQSVIDKKQSELDVLIKENRVLGEKVGVAEKKLAQLDVLLEQHAAMKADLENLNEIISIKTRKTDLLQQEYQALKGLLDKQLRTEVNNQDCIDKRIVTKLIVTYFLSSNKREVLEIMAGILNFTEQNRADVGIVPETTKKGWLTSWFYSSGDDKGIPKEVQESNQDKNLTDLWISFLLSEAENEKHKTDQQAQAQLQPEGQPPSQSSPSPAQPEVPPPSPTNS